MYVGWNFNYYDMKCLTVKTKQERFQNVTGNSFLSKRNFFYSSNLQKWDKSLLIGFQRSTLWKISLLNIYYFSIVQFLLFQIQNIFVQVK